MDVKSTISSSVLESDSELSLTNSCSISGSDGTASMPTSPENADQMVGDMRSTCSQNPAAHPSSRVASTDDFMGLLALGAIRVHNTSGSEVLNIHSCVCVAEPHAGTTPPWFEINTLVVRGWMQTDVVENERHARYYTVRVFVNAENIARDNRKSPSTESRKLLKQIFAYLDKSKSAWDGHWTLDAPFESYLVCPEQESLFYLFNTLPAPSPSTKDTSDAYARRAMEDILDNSVAGLRTTMYSYQQRSAAMMIQRETKPKRSPDPRKRCFLGPTGQSFYYDGHEGVLLLQPSLYEEPRGGILAETMGYGKTLICLAVVLASKGHYAQVPHNRTKIPRAVGPKVASLTEMACAKVIEDTVPWKAELYDLTAKGYHHGRCIEMLRSSYKEYTERLLTPRTPNRSGKRRSEKTVRLSSTTLIVVPSNLLVQWQQEVEKHTEEGALDVLVIDHTCKAIPNCGELCRYDVVLIAKGRLDQEYRDDDLNTGRRGKDCEEYQSPFTDIRWLRVILDEGAEFASTSIRTNAMAMLDKMYVDRRWIVSGTPSNSLRGVEVGLAANETISDEKAAEENLHSTLEKRRKGDPLDRESSDLDKLKIVVTRFLKVQPWANAPGSDRANWWWYLAPFDRRGQRRNITGLRALLESIVVRHTINDIEIDLALPPLSNKVAYLEPSFYDKLSINLFNTVLVSNAVTSERTDEDYMFHPRNRKQLDLLISNLRQSNFHWVGFKKHDIEQTVRVSKSYMEKHSSEMSSRDRTLLLTAIEMGERATTHPGWLAFSTFHEIGVFVENFPEHASETWALGQPSEPLLLGTVQARAAQQYIEEHATDECPDDGLPGAGVRAMQAARKRAADEDKVTARNRSAGSKLIEEPKIKDRTKQTKCKRSMSSTESPHAKRPRLDHPPRPYSLPMNSPLHKTSIIGFCSTKLSYLVDQVLLYQSSSKIIIFYDANNIAFWLAEALELLSLSFLIYANTLPPTLRSKYLSLFHSDPTIRILLMDVRQASHGLHIAAANRVYIVNPIWQPNVEAQAIKRAHRIGQTKPVYVETLVLRGTLEDKMLRRRREMSNVELRRAEKSVLDDGTMNQIIKDEGFLTFSPEEELVAGQVARLRVPQRLFGRRRD